MKRLFQLSAAIVELLFVVTVLVLIGVLVINFAPRLQEIIAENTRAPFVPVEEVQQLATSAKMTSSARKIFYAAYPQIDEDRSSFESHCARPVSPNSVELGCYTSNNRIYILRVKEVKLSTEMIVVAAHEMLHAAYVKLSTNEKNNINNELENAVTYLANKQLNEEIVSYRINEPGQRDNELHSLIGTEYNGLAESLEKYYSTYFQNRSVVVGFSDGFNQVFKSLSAKIDSLRVEVRQTRSLMNTYLRRHAISSYNSLVPKINDLINQYNEVVLSYNQLSRSLIGPETTLSTDTP